MRPSPLILLVVVLAGLGLAAVPLARLTRAQPAPSANATAASVESEEKIRTLVRLRFAHAPVAVNLLEHERSLLTVGEGGEETLLEVEAELALPSEGVEFRVEVTWPNGTPQTAVTLEVEPEGLDARAATRWSDVGTLSEIIPFTWP